MLLVVGGIKGGAGKSTLATNLSVANELSGRKTLLIDADEQRSASDWAEQRYASISNKPHPNFPTISLVGRSIHNQIQKLEKDYDEVVVDTGGRDTTSQRAALTIADVFLIPFKPRSFDIWTICKVKSLVNEIRTVNPKLVTFVCINQADAKGLDNDAAMKILEDENDFICLPNIVGNRKSFSNAAADGLSVLEMEKKDSKAIEEIWILHRNIYTKYAKCT